MTSKSDTPPSTKTVPTTETLHGHKLSDDYRWLEDVESKDVVDWIDKQDKFTTSQHKLHTQYDKWQSRVQSYLQIDKEWLPARRGEQHFFVSQLANEDLPVLWVRSGDTGNSKKLIDLNKLNLDDGSPTLEFWDPSFDGKLLAYAISVGGKEICSLHIMDVESGADIEPPIPNASEMSWNDDSTGFYYIRGPKPGTVSDNDLRMNSKLYVHQIGKPYEHDVMIFGKDRPADDMLDLSRTKNSPYTVLAVSQEWSKNNIYLIDITTHEIKPFIIGKDAVFSALPTKSGLIIWTNYQASNAKLLFIDYKNMNGDISVAKVLIPEKDTTLQWFYASKSRIFAGYSREFSDEVEIYDHNGIYQDKLPIQSPCSITLRTSLEDDDVYASVQSPINPGVIYKINALSLDKKIVSSTDSPHNPKDYLSYVEWTTSKDGTRMPLLISHKKELVRNGSTPTLLYGYGGFANSEDASYLGANMAWLEAGGVFADAIIRGGGEYGNEWYKKGILKNKQNSFDDFIAHAENLIKLGITDSSRLGIYGGSNGGLLVGAVAVQRPDLYKAVVCQVPLLDMVHFHTLLIASRWTSEYGNPDNKQDFDRMLTWSPYHNVKPDQIYPSFYLTTAENDTRVHPMHALKMTAMLQNTTNPSTTLLWVERGTGHSNTMPKNKIAESITRRLSFFGWQLDLRL